MGETFADVAGSGPLLLAIAVGRARRAGQLPVAVRAAAGARLPVVRDRAGRRRPRRRRGTPRLTRPAAAATTYSRRHPGPATGAGPGARRAPCCSSLGFTVVFTLLAILVASIGRALLTHQRALEIVVGVLIIVLGLAFRGLVPGLQRELRIHKLPAAGLARRAGLRRASSRCPGCRASARRSARCSGWPRHSGADRPGGGARAGVLPRARGAVRALRAGLPPAARGLRGGPPQQPVGHPDRRRCCSSWSGWRWSPAAGTDFLIWLRTTVGPGQVGI